MLRILHDTNYDFIRWWKVMAGITVAFILLGLGSLAIKPPNYSIEFTGGTLMQLEFTQPPDVGEIRSALDDAGIHGAEIQQFGSNRDFTVRAQNPSQVAAQAKGAENIAVTIEAVLKKKFGENSFKAGRDRRDTSIVPDYTRLPLDSLRVAIRHGCSYSNEPRRLHDDRVPEVDAPRDLAHRCGGPAHRARLFSERHDHHLRSRA